ncbi:aminopeptidase P, N-terminal domain protein [Collimonas arenae]|uniref:Xaa-Pro aminopeptidase n=1 Tax=Collimonas arenae TaxID=279058 RepID=A0A127PPL3_9BURK|nr:aminopeptidase P family protein [Collimonas arenae]AMO99554.1 aminopeptidase P, N-terminal domain protein [Collimonas arenae]AMP09454.1 aminopeptidase P, N-terminal domain protein [Collimonas arenae]
MFDRAVYAQRRQQLKQRFTSGLLLLPGNTDVSMNYLHNHYWFRQDSSFSYFFGLDQPDLAAVIDIDAGADHLFGDDPGLDDVIWVGQQQTLVERAAAVAVASVRPYRDLAGMLAQAREQGRTIHYLPPYRGETILELARLLSCTTEQCKAGASESLIDAVIALREIKNDAEIAEIESALAVTRDMHVAAMRLARPDTFEYQVVAAMEGIMRSHDLQNAYPMIFSRSGEILHNRNHKNRLQRGELVVNDSGSSSALGYASDITRTFPVGGRFSERQRTLYEIVLAAQQLAIDAMRPGISYLDVHKLAATHMAAALSELGFFRGAPQQIVESGAYAICFPHGLGHQLGLDVHDMEGLGETRVGYDASVSRSDMFGLRNLRLAKPLRAGMVVTVEPGLYFIPVLIRRWQAEARHSELINYAKFIEYIDFGGIRIEDDVLVTETGARVLGPAIPKSCADIEALMTT